MRADFGLNGSRSGRTSAALILFLAFAFAAAPGRPAAAQEVSMAWLNDVGPYVVTDEGPVPGIGSKIALYLPNRLLDIADVIHFDIGFGFGALLNIHATRMLQVGGGMSALSRVGIDGRGIGFYSENRSEISILPWSVEGYTRRRATFGTFRDFDSASQREQMYEDLRDYFEIGGSATIAIIGFQGDIRPSAIGDFIVGWAGFDPQSDDYPRRFTRGKKFNFGQSERRSIQRMAIVTSRVTRSTRVGSEAESGVAVYNHRSVGEFFWGRLGRWAGSDDDAAEEIDLNNGLIEMGYDIAPDMAERFEQAFARNAVGMEIIPASTFAPFENGKVEMRVADETVMRLPNYAGLCRAYEADAVCDLRLLEWSVFKNRPGQGLRIRLNVELKIIKYPENEILVDIAEIVYDVEKKTGTTMDEFRSNNSRLVRIETQQAIDILIPQFIDQLFEK